MKTGLQGVLGVVVVLATAGVAAAQGDDAETTRLLAGKWRQDFANGTTTETVYVSTGTFTATTVNGPYRFFLTGRWEVRGGVVVHTVTNWSPRELPNLFGPPSPIHIPEKLLLPVRFLDRNTFENADGLVRRVF